MEAPGLKSVLVVQYMRFEKKEFIVGNKVSFVIRFKGTQQALTESVAVGYGTQKGGI